MITDYSSVVAPSINQDEPEIKLLIAFILPYPMRLNLIHHIHFFNEFKLISTLLSQKFWPDPIQSSRLIDLHLYPDLDLSKFRK